MGQIRRSRKRKRIEVPGGASKERRGEEKKIGRENQRDIRKICC